MQRRLTHYTTIFMMCIFFASSGGCEKPIELESKWQNCEITIDGVGDEWGGATIYAAKQKVSLTMLNDSSYMYIRINTRDRQVQAQVLGMGLTLWFDPDGGKDKTFGIHFPLGMEEMDMPQMPGGYEVSHDDRFEKMFTGLSDELGILGSDEEDICRISFSEAAMHGINVRLGYLNGNLIYELKVPLVHDEDHVFAIGLTTAGIDTNITIGIGFETPEIDVEEMKKNMEERGRGMPPGGSGMPPGGMPSGGTPPGGMRGGPQMPERLALWTKVKLAHE
jgi:hypothetical protein